MTDPACRQVVPTVFEHTESGGETLDPLAEERGGHRPADPSLSHRGAFLTTDLCFIHCRHRFRRRFTGTFQGPATKLYRECARYVEKHPGNHRTPFHRRGFFTLNDVHWGTDDRSVSVKTTRSDYSPRSRALPPEQNGSPRR